MSKIVLAEQASAPDTPASGNVAIYVDENGDLAWKDDAGNVTKIASAGAYTLTVPATGTAALLATAQTFTAAQKFGTGAGTAQVAIKSQAAGTVPLVAQTAASQTANAFEVKRNAGTDILNVSESNVRLSLLPVDLSTAAGPSIYIGQNSNASTPAAGHLRLVDAGNTVRRIWPDASGNLRIHTADPTNANDTAGTVIGTQTSQAATKDILGDGVSPADALAAVLAAPVYRFKYKSGAFNNTEFHGITTDDSPQFGMDEGRVFNPVSAFGYMVQTVKALHARIQQLEEQIANG